MKKIIKKLFIVLTIALSSMGLFCMPVMAENLIDTSLYAREDLPAYMRMNEMERDIKHVYHKFDDEDLPAYCMNEYVDGITKDKTYDVSVESEIADTDIKLWRIITNGYPYKTAEELGCTNENQAYDATQEAVYFYLHNKQATEEKFKRTLLSLKPIDDEGTKVHNAMEKILNDAENSTATKPSKEIIVTEDEEEWKKDEKDDKYVYKTFSVSSPTEMKNYEVTIENLEDSIQDKIKIVGEENQEKDNFEPTENFKIMILADEVEKAVEFDVNVTAQLKTMPIYFGDSLNKQLQSYALTAMYENSKKDIEETYQGKPVQQPEKKLPQTGM